jgi:hypothetical protein
MKPDFTKSETYHLEIQSPEETDKMKLPPFLSAQKKTY